MRTIRFNLVVSHLPGMHSRRIVREDMRRVLGEKVSFPVQGQSLTLARYHGDPLEAVNLLREGLPRDTVILKVVPALEVVEPEIDAVKEAVHMLLDGQPEGSYAIRIQGRITRRGHPLSPREAIDEIARGIERPVNLSEPDILVLVRVVRLRGVEAAAIYVGPPSGILRLAVEG